MCVSISVFQGTVLFPCVAEGRREVGVKGPRCCQYFQASPPINVDVATLWDLLCWHVDGTWGSVRLGEMVRVCYSWHR